MRCIKCSARASVEIRRHRAAYCGAHFIDYVHDQVGHNIRKYRMIGPDDRVLVAVSGGKDSLALWDTLETLGHSTAGLHIHLGIGDYSDRSREKALAFAEARGLELIEIDMAREYGLSIPVLSRAAHRVACSGCGQSKRYVMNRAAREHGFTVLATGHNLDDEAATLLGNVLHWQTDFMARQAPVLESGDGLVKKVKPLFTLTEREMASYCLLSGIDYIEEECPFAVGAKSLRHKDLLNAIEAESPGTISMFVAGFVEKVKPLLEHEDTATVGRCVKCGEPTTTEVCGFCRMWDKARRVRAGAGPTP